MPCVHALSVPYPPFTASWLSKLILLWDFLVICKSAVTVMRATQRRRRCGKCQHVSEEWHRTSELSTRGPSDSTQHTHDKAKLVPTRIIPAHVLNGDSCELIHAHSKYKNGRPKNSFCQERCSNTGFHSVVQINEMSAIPVRRSWISVWLVQNLFCMSVSIKKYAHTLRWLYTWAHFVDMLGKDVCGFELELYKKHKHRDIKWGTLYRLFGWVYRLFFVLFAGAIFPLWLQMSYFMSELFLAGSRKSEMKYLLHV